MPSCHEFIRCPISNGLHDNHLAVDPLGDLKAIGWIAQKTWTSVDLVHPCSSRKQVVPCCAMLCLLGLFCSIFPISGFTFPESIFIGFWVALLFRGKHGAWETPGCILHGRRSQRVASAQNALVVLHQPCSVQRSRIGDFVPGILSTFPGLHAKSLTQASLLCVFSLAWRGARLRNGVFLASLLLAPRETVLHGFAPCSACCFCASLASLASPYTLCAL